MEVKIIQAPAIKAVGIAQRFTQDSTGDIPALWDRFSAHATDIPNMTGERFLGICDGFTEESGISSFRYTAAAEVTEFGDMKDGLIAQELTPQTYAVFTHKITTDNLPEEFKATLNYIWGNWFPQSGYEHVCAPDFELYDSRFTPPMDGNPPSGEIDVYIPVRKK